VLLPRPKKPKRRLLVASYSDYVVREPGESAVVGPEGGGLWAPKIIFKTTVNKKLSQFIKLHNYLIVIALGWNLLRSTGKSNSIIIKSISPLRRDRGGLETS
jgi:hypothetical protein